MLKSINFKLKIVSKTKYFRRSLATVESIETMVTFVTKATIIRTVILVSLVRD